MTTRFDDWEGEYLAHFRTKGSKNGVRRYQTESGKWTPLGLRERREREGWGDGDRQARKAAKAQKRAERKAARAERIAAYNEQQRKSNVKTMTDDELRAAIERKKMEAEYKELTKSPLLKAGEKLVSGYMDYRVKKDEAENARKKLAIEDKRIDAEVLKARERTKQTKLEKGKARLEVRGGIKAQRKAELAKAKTEYRGTTLRGNVMRAIGQKMNAGMKDKYTKIRQTEGQIAADKLLRDAKQSTQQQQQRQQEKQQREQRKKQKRTERILRRQYGVNNLN